MKAVSDLSGRNDEVLIVRSTSTVFSPKIHPDFLQAARGLGGALLFALPMLMTMEMWELGLYANPLRLLLLCLLNIRCWWGLPIGSVLSG